MRSVGRIAQHGEDGSLDGLAHRLKGDFLGAGESRVERFGVQRGGISIALAETAQDLRGDDARVATGAHERALRDGPADRGRTGPHGKLHNVFDHRLDGKRHIGAGIAIRHGEHVQAVHFLLARGQNLAGGGDGVDNILGMIRHDYAISWYMLALWRG